MYTFNLFRGANIRPFTGTPNEICHPKHFFRPLTINATITVLLIKVNLMKTFKLKI